MAALVASLPLAAKLGFMEASGAPDGTDNRTWQLSLLGKAWLLANVVASCVFFLVSALLQKLWEPLREGEIDSRAISATIGALTMILTFVNGSVAGVKLFIL